MSKEMYITKNYTKRVNGENQTIETKYRIDAEFVPSKANEICSEFIKNYCISKGKESIQWYIDKLEEEKETVNEKTNTTEKVKLTAFEIRKAFIEKYFPTLLKKEKKNSREDLINELKALL